MSDSRTIWINAGETSGDLHGAILARALARRDAGLSFTGMAGPAMREAGVADVARTEELSVMGFTEVLARLWSIFGLLSRIRREMTRLRPRAVVLIDAPAFNFRVARMAKRLGIPVFYYISPKLWARNQGRARFIRDFVDRMICIFPFEKKFYARFGVDADYVGHPLLDEMDKPEIMDAAPFQGRVGILPGSRQGEITSLTPLFSEAAGMMSAALPGLEFEAVCAPGVSEDRLRELWGDKIPLDILPAKNRYARIRTWQCCLAASGTATLETALLGVPTVVAYRLSALTFFLAKMLVKVRHVSLPNIILDREVFPELLQDAARPELLARAALDWLEDSGEMSSVRADLDELWSLLGPTGAPDRAAGIILDHLSHQG